MTSFEELLSGGDLRSIGKSNIVALAIQSQEEFDGLFGCMRHQNRVVVMRAADAIEKVTISKPYFLRKHKKELLEMCTRVVDKELKWHLALLVPRLLLEKDEFGFAWGMLTDWAMDKRNSRIVRVNAIQGLFEMLPQKSILEQDFCQILSQIEKENIPSLNARIRKLKNSRC